MKEYSRYMKSIGEKESPITQKTFNFYGTDVSLESLEESEFKSIQNIGVTDSILEDVVRTTFHHLWKSEYVGVNDVDIISFQYDKDSGTYAFECLSNTKSCKKIKILSKGIDIDRSNIKPIIEYEDYIPKITIVEDKIVSFDSFSKFYDSIGDE